MATETEDQTDSVWKSEREVWKIREKGDKEVSGVGGHFSGGHRWWGRDEESSGPSGMGIRPSAIPEAGPGCRLQGWTENSGQATEGNSAAESDWVYQDSSPEEHTRVGHFLHIQPLIYDINKLT